MSSQRHGYGRVLAPLVEAAAALATEQAYLQLYYWVGTDNGRAIGFAQNFGFRTTDYRRPLRNSDLEPGEEIEMVLSLEPDAPLAPNPTSGKPSTGKAPSAKTWPKSSLRAAKVLSARTESNPRSICHAVF